MGKKKKKNATKQVILSFGGKRGSAARKQQPPPDLTFNNKLIDPTAPEFSPITRQEVRGLTNLGNTCFFNSVLQNLASTSLLCQYFNSLPRRREGPLTARLRQFVRDFTGQGGSVYNPSLVLSEVSRQAPRFKGYHQQDSQELLRYLLDCVDEEEKKELQRMRKELEGQQSGSHQESKKGSGPREDITAHEGTTVHDASREEQTPSQHHRTGEGEEMQQLEVPKTSFFYFPESSEIEEVSNPVEDEEPSPPPSALTAASASVLEREDEDTSIVARIFGGTLCSLVLCSDWRLASVAVDPVFDVSLPLPGTPAMGGGKSKKKGGGALPSSWEFSGEHTASGKRMSKKQREKAKKQKKKREEELRQLEQQVKPEGQERKQPNTQEKPKSVTLSPAAANLVGFEPSDAWLNTASKKKLVEWLQGNADAGFLHQHKLAGKAKQNCKNKTSGWLVEQVRDVWKAKEHAPAQHSKPLARVSEKDKSAATKNAVGKVVNVEEGKPQEALERPEKDVEVISLNKGGHGSTQEGQAALTTAESPPISAATWETPLTRGSCTWETMQSMEKDELVAWIQRFMTQPQLQECKLEGKPKRAARKLRVEKVRSIAEALWHHLPPDQPTEGARKCRVRDEGGNEEAEPTDSAPEPESSEKEPEPAAAAMEHSETNEEQQAQRVQEQNISCSIREEEREELEGEGRHGSEEEEEREGEGRHGSEKVTSEAHNSTVEGEPTVTANPKDDDKIEKAKDHENVPPAADCREGTAGVSEQSPQPGSSGVSADDGATHEVSFMDTLPSDTYYAYSNVCKAGDEPWLVKLPRPLALGDSVALSDGSSVTASPSSLYGCLAQFCTAERLSVAGGNGYRFHFQPKLRGRGNGSLSTTDAAPAELSQGESSTDTGDDSSSYQEVEDSQGKAEKSEDSSNDEGSGEHTGQEGSGSEDGAPSEEQKREEPDGQETTEKQLLSSIGDVDVMLLPSSKQQHLRDAVRRILFLDAPPVLTIHLKRFAQNMRGSFQKISKAVEFPLVLDLAPFTLSRSSTLDPTGAHEREESKDESLLYDLNGVVVHQGGMSGGHYVAYVRKVSDMGDVWYHISDSSVSRVAVDRVLNSQAYLLFYCRQGFTVDDVAAGARRRTTFRNQMSSKTS